MDQIVLNNRKIKAAMSAGSLNLGMKMFYCLHAWGRVSKCLLCMVRYSQMWTGLKIGKWSMKHSYHYTKKNTRLQNWKSDTLTLSCNLIDVRINYYFFLLSSFWECLKMKDTLFWLLLIWNWHFHVADGDLIPVL